MEQTRGFFAQVSSYLTGVVLYLEGLNIVGTAATFAGAVLTVSMAYKNYHEAQRIKLDNLKIEKELGNGDDNKNS